MNELRFGNSGNEIKEDPAVIMARKTLAGKKYAGGPIPKCYGCGKAYEQGTKELRLVYLPMVKQQRKLCPDCMPLRDEIGRREEDCKSVNIPVENRKPDGAMPLSAEIAKFPPPVKECLNCDCNLFYLLRGGIIKCSGCGTEYKAGR